MKSATLAIATVVGSAMLLPAVGSAADPTPAAKPDYKFEKCYGIAKAGTNDCQTATSSCAGTSRRDMQIDAWIYLPAGTCARIAGGNLEPKRS